MTPYLHRDRVRWSDCDPLGIIYYGAWVRFFEGAEHDLFREAGLPFERFRVQEGIWLPRKHFEVEFHAPAKMDELIEIRASIARIGTTSMTMRFEGYGVENGEHKATGLLTVVCVAKEGLVKFPIPDWVREALAPYTDATP